MRETTISLHGRTRRLLDEVDVITSVSGGSYTAAYYGLFGNRIFTNFEDRFLKRDIEGAFKSLLVNPLVLTSLAASEKNRSDIVAEWLGENVFENKTFSDLQAQRGPFVIINASDINTGTTFSFVQQQFSFLCSSIEGFPVARAVMASSAVPGYFSPIALRNYAGNCVGRHAPWVGRALQSHDLLSREYTVARALDRYMHPETMPVVRLVDGGMTDNLGVRGSMMSPVLHHGNVPDMSGAFDPAALDRVSKVLVIVANAQTYEDYEWSRKGRDPGLIGALSASFDSAIGMLNSETVALARSGFMQWAQHVNRRPSRIGREPVDVSFAVLTFDHIKDEARRRHFNSIPMALSLPADHVDGLRTLAGELLRTSPEFQHFLAEFRE